ncbi:MAG: hypothetical protein JNL19_08855 [Burkholderiales bacterium]|nr:hypothetical protein [Burkholderiales bacterium]
MNLPPNPSTAPMPTLSDADALGRAIGGALRLEDAPAAAITAAVGLWPSQASVQAAAAAPGSTLIGSLQSAVKRIQAVLTFDSWATTPAALGLRSAGLSRQSRHLMFSAEGHDIDLRIAGSNDSYVLAGQMLGPDHHGPVSITVNTAANDDDHATEPHRQAELDELGSFELDAVRAGTYWMTVRMGHDVVELPPIEVGQR